MLHLVIAGAVNKKIAFELGISEITVKLHRSNMMKKMGASFAGIETQPSTLLVFGNPALGTQFITANPQAGIDWPVRLLVYEDRAGQVWAEYNDFAYIAQRHAIASRDPQFAMASQVIASVVASVAR